MITLFLATSVASGVAILVRHHVHPATGASVGASAGLFGLLGAARLTCHPGSAVADMASTNGYRRPLASMSAVAEHHDAFSDGFGRCAGRRIGSLVTNALAYWQMIALQLLSRSLRA